MRGAMVFTLALALVGLAPVAAIAQEESDKGFLVNFLEESLSDAGRKVEITGFAGALSSRATLQKLTIADDQGVWLEIDDAVLDWSRTALLSGEVIINELSAGRIALARIPSTGEAGTSPEAGSFALPELPVSIDIGTIRAERIELDAPVLGEALTASLDASLHLADGDGQATLHLSRTDPGPAEVIRLTASYTNETGALNLDLDAQEGAGGLLSRRVGLPGAPPMELSLKGDGTIDDFAARLRLATEGEERLAGPVTLSLDADGARAFSARVEGNPAPLFLPDYAEFLGDNLSLALSGRRHADGRTEIDTLGLKARTLALDGQLSIAADGLPEAFALEATLADPGGEPVLLPLTGPPTRVKRADIALHFDANKGSGWTASATLSGLARPGLNVAGASITGAGTITREGATRDGARSVDGRLDLALSGLAGLDPALLAATGPDIGGSLDFRWQDGSGALELPRIALAGAYYGLDGHLRLRGLDTALTADGALTARMRDLGRLSALAGRPLGGAGTLTLSGEASPLTGAFDLSLTLAGQDLRLGIPQADRLLTGQSSIKAAARRDGTGITLRSLSGLASSLRIEGTGTLSSQAMHLKGSVDWRDLADLGAGFGGSLAARAGFDGLPADGALTLDGTGHNLRIGQAEVDRLIAGDSTLSAEVALAGGVPSLRRLLLNAPALSLGATGSAGSDTLDVTGRLADLALLAPEFPGPVTLAGTIRPDDATRQTVDLHLTGPAALDARLTGRVASQPALALTLRADAALLNGLLDPVTLAGALSGDLTLNGGWGPSALSGRVTLAGGRLAVPARATALEGIALEANIAGGRATLAASAHASEGGGIRLDGPLSLTAPYTADLSATLSALHLRDPGLYDTTLDGTLHLSGPLLGAARLSGGLDLGPTELRVPSTSPAALADVERFRHLRDSAAVRTTRTRAGMDGTGPREARATGGPDWGLDLTIRAPGRIFLRGRGLDAELGGALHLAGSLHNPIPSGGMDLIRGRLDILGKRLELTRASLRLEGGFTPWIDVAATNAGDGVTSTVAISGPADDPAVAFTSEPELPQEEVLAHLLFGRGLGKMSAFQAVQLASAVATLAGRGGEGLVGRLRSGLGLDDLDITTAENGDAEISAGKYLSENIYSELGTDQNGKSRVDLNLILRPGVTLRGSADSAGDSSIGLYMERDY